MGFLRLIPALAVLLGFTSAMIGLALLWVPLAFLAGGAILMAFGLLVEVDRG